MTDPRRRLEFGTDDRATITTQQGCTWTASPDASWITMTGGQWGSGPGTISFRVGDDPVSFTVAPKSTTTARSGTITVRDKVVRITQSGR